MNGSSFPTQTVGADRIRPQHKAPLQGACAGSTYSSTLQGVCVQPGTCRKSGVTGGFYPPLQGVCVHPGSCEKPGLRADAIRPYWCDGSRGLGGEYLNRLYHLFCCNAPGFVKKAESHKKYQNCQFQFVKVAAIIKAYTGGTTP